MNVRVDLNTPIKDGTEVVFRSPVDCSQVTGLKVYYLGGSQEFAFADAHGNNVGNIDHLFAENVAVKVILDVTHSMAFVQNADTNAYLEGRFDGIIKQVCPPINETGLVVQCEPVEGYPLAITTKNDNGFNATVCGKNLYNKEAYPVNITGYIYKAYGHIATSQTYKRTSFIPVSHLAGQTITLNYAPTSASNPGMAFYKYLPDGTEADCKNAYCGGGSGKNIKVPADATHMAFSVAVGDATKDIQIEIGSTATNFEKYVEKSVEAVGAVELAAFKGINTVYAYDQGNAVSVTVTGKADPVAIIEKLTNAIISLGANI